MEPPISPGLLPVVYGVMGLGVVACIVIWTNIAARLGRRQPVLPYERRRPVPWRGRDVAVILLVYFLPALTTLLLACLSSFHAPSHPVRSGQRNVAHPVLDLLGTNPSTPTLLFCIFTVVVVAPVTEEVLFRLVLQGWLEAAESASRRRGRRWPIQHGFWPVAISSVLFALLHFRTGQPRLSPQEVLLLLTEVTVWNLLTLTATIAWLRWQCGATLVDLGLAPGKWFEDIRLGILAFLAVAAPIYTMQAALQWMLKRLAVAADPITLTFFAVALGLLYFRTHRLVPSIVLHMALNGTSLAIAWAVSG